MSDDPAAEADRRFEAALEETGTRDPRDHFRDRLKTLRSENPEAFRKATEYYRERVVGAIAGGADPVEAWRGYGIFLAGLEGPGRTVQVDSTGRATDYEPDAPADALILFLPDRTRRPAVLIGGPKDLSPPQRATSSLLVR